MLTKVVKTDKERWRWVVAWKGYYLVSSYGRVKSATRVIQNRDGVSQPIKARFLRPGRIDKFGHLQVTLCRNGKKKVRYVHQLVLEAFIGPCPEGMVVRHFPDRDPTNNRLDNLSYSTMTTNQRDRVAHGTDTRGERNGMAKLTEKEVKQIRHLCTEKKQTMTEIGRMFGVSKQVVGYIHHRKTWKNVV